MSTVAHLPSQEQIVSLEEQLEHLLTEQADRLARQDGFVQRTSPITGSLFARGLIFGFLNQPEATYTALRHMIANLGVRVTSQAIEQRMTPAAATFLHDLLDAAVSIVVCGEPVAADVLSRFNGVFLQDGSIIGLPPELRERWQGTGSLGEGGHSGVQLQARLNVHTGQLQGPLLQDGKAGERSGPLSLRSVPLPAGGLLLADTGWFDIPTMRWMQSQGQYWACYAKADLTMSDDRGVRCGLPELLKRYEQQGRVDTQVLIGVQQLPARLIAFRVSKTVADERRKRATRRQPTRNKGARRDVRVGQRHRPTSLQGRKLHRAGKKRLELAQWTIIVTNGAVALLSATETRILLRCRWQIELLWKLWKQMGQVDTWRSEKPARIECELDAKLIAMLIQHWVLVMDCWSNPHRSLVKASALVRSLAPCFALAFHGLLSLHDLLVHCRFVLEDESVNSRRTRPNTSQLLLDPLLAERRA